MKNIIIEVIKNMLKVFFILPIRKKRVVFSAYSGKSYSCNPKYITEYMLKNHIDYEIVWAFCDVKKYSYLASRFKIVKYKSLKYIIYTLTAHVVIDNVESWSILPKRKGQIIINTWHGGGAYKGVGLKRLDSSTSTDNNMLKKNKRIDLYLSSSLKFTELTLRDSFKYEGKVLSSGLPRNDFLLNDDNESRIQEIKNNLGVKKEEKVVLYAPTFRNDASYKYDLDFARIINSLNERFGGQWIVLYRLHYYIDGCLGNIGYVKNVSDYPDMQELLLISDVLITDYSSSMWDFSLMYKPCFLYTPDLDEYIKERCFYTPIDEWPYVYCLDESSLNQSIVDYDRNSSEVKIKKHHDDCESYETGRATQTVMDYIIKVTK